MISAWKIYPLLDVGPFALQSQCSKSCDSYSHPFRIVLEMCNEARQCVSENLYLKVLGWLQVVLEVLHLFGLVVPAPVLATYDLPSVKDNLLDRRPATVPKRPP